MSYDTWLEKPYQDQCDRQYEIDQEIDEYRDEPEFLEDAKKWAIKQGIHPNTCDSLENDYLESDECYFVCVERVDNRKWSI